MAKYIYRILIFCSILIAIVYGLNALAMSGLHRSVSGDFGVWNKLVGGDINAQILFNGSSRTLVHFDCDTVAALTGKSCYNIGLDGSPLNFQVPCLKTYLKHNRTPEIVVQGLDIISLDSRDNIFHAYQYIPYLDEDTLYENLVKFDAKFWRYRYIPLFGFAHYGEILREEAWRGWLGDPGYEERRKGYRPVDQVWGDDFERFKKMYPDGRAYDIETDAIANLRRLIEITHQSGSKIILVYSPEYYENYPLSSNRDEIIGIYKQIAAEYNVPFWDYSNTPITRVRDYFYNSQHLNRTGASVFSRNFAGDLNNYLAGLPHNTASTADTAASTPH